MSELLNSYGTPSRGVTAADVERAADALLREGRRPTIEKVREKIGSGSPNTINPLLDAWWKRLSARLDSGPAALHRLPESVAHVAEALWMQALDEGRRRATQEQDGSARRLARDHQDLEVRSYVLTLREGELDARLQEKERREVLLESQIQTLTVQLRTGQANREAQDRRIAELTAHLEKQRQQIGKFMASATMAGRPNGDRTNRSSGSAPPKPKVRARRKDAEENARKARTSAKATGQNNVSKIGKRGRPARNLRRSRKERPR